MARIHCMMMSVISTSLRLGLGMSPESTFILCRFKEVIPDILRIAGEVNRESHKHSLQKMRLSGWFLLLLAACSKAAEDSAAEGTPNCMDLQHPRTWLTA